MELRGLRDVEERTRRPGAPEPADPASVVVLDTVLALRQTVRERGKLPFDFAGLRALDALGDLGQTLDRCLRKKQLSCLSSPDRLSLRWNLPGDPLAQNRI